MAQLLGTVVADFETQLATALAVGDTTATLQSATDDDSVALPAGRYFFTIDGDSSSKEHIACTLSGTSLTAIKTVTRQGVETSGVARKHRVGATVTITNFAHIKQINDLLDGTTDFDSATPLKYDGDPTLSNDEDIATKKYVDDVAIAGGADSSTTTKGITKMSVAPASASNPIAVGDNDPRVPTSDENDAMAGTSGTPSSSNKFVTNDDTAETGNSVVVRTKSTGKLDESILPDSSEVTLTAGENISQYDAVVIGDGVEYSLASNDAGSNSENLTSSQWMSQKFTTSSGAITISSVKIKLSLLSGSASRPVRVSLRADSAGKPTGSDLDSKDVSASLTTSPTYITFTFDTPVSVSASTDYHLVARLTDGNSDVYIDRDNDASTGTNKSTDSGSSWSANNGELEFEVFEINNTAGEIYQSDASSNNFRANNFIGIAQEAISASSTGEVSVTGVATTSGLTAGSQYFLSDTSGSVSTSAGSQSVKIGQALSATQLLLKHDNS